MQNGAHEKSTGAKGSSGRIPGEHSVATRRAMQRFGAYFPN